MLPVATAINQPNEPVCQVAVPLPLKRCFDYAWPFAEPPVPGQVVQVPFGQRQLTGIVVAAQGQEGSGGATDPTSLKAVLQVSPEPALDPSQLDLARWCARYYHHALGEVLATMLTPGWAKPAPAPQDLALSETGQAALSAGIVRGPKQRQAMDRLAQGPASRTQLRVLGISASVIKALKDSGRVVEQDAGSQVATTPGPPLTGEQQAAVAAVRAETGFAPFLLHGITGSGKTEVYLDLICDCIAGGQQALVIVPEIGLTPQLEHRFQSRLGGTVALMHSGLSDGERGRSWHRAASGQASVIIGTRSAIFCPLPRPGLIVVDEEHDLSLKQQEGFRYSARDVAVRRARQLDIPVILGSATPSLESLNNAWAERYRYLRLSQRPGSAAMPAVDLIDSRGTGGDESLTAEASQALTEVLARQEQALVFLNRRGFAPTLICDACGWVAECRRCDSRLTLHRSRAQMRCHHCGAAAREPTSCPECRSTRLAALGLGTQRLEETLIRMFPDTTIWRVDRDAVRSRQRLLTLLDEVNSGQSGILVGTQMLAKGHDFPNVTLVVVVNMDQALLSSDFRAGERSAQLLMQVSGRAGRADKPGRVLIQTHQKEHPMFRQVMSHGYIHWARQLMDERRAAGYPPSGFMALLRVNAHQLDAVESFIQAAMPTASPLPDVEMLGPLPAPMERRAGRYHGQVLISSASRQSLHRLLDQWLPVIAALPLARKVRWSIDIDPQDLF